MPNYNESISILIVKCADKGQNLFFALTRVVQFINKYQGFFCHIVWIPLYNPILFRTCQTQVKLFLNTSFVREDLVFQVENKYCATLCKTRQHAVPAPSTLYKPNGTVQCVHWRFIKYKKLQYELPTFPSWWMDFECPLRTRCGPQRILPSLLSWGSLNPFPFPSSGPPQSDCRHTHHHKTFCPSARCLLAQ